MPFVQIIEFTTSRFSEVEPLMEDWVAKTEGKRSASRSVITRDRARANTFVQVVEFPSYEAAMANSDLPETQQVAERLSALCDAPPAFRNLDLVREDTL
jgi:quinol monooxygenase YgiN